MVLLNFFFSSRRRHTRLQGDWSSDVCSSDLRITTTEASEARLAATDALAARLSELSGGKLDRGARTADIADALVASIGMPEREAAEADVRQGGGGELRLETDCTLAPRFHSPR